MRKVYFAGPMFNDAEKAFNQLVTDRMEATGKVEVFLPQRDGLKAAECKLEPKELSKKIFDLDVDKLEECDVLLFICDGRCPDDGACVELGMAYMYNRFVDKNRLILGLDTDGRGMFSHIKINPLVEHCFDEFFKSVDDLIGYIDSM